MDEKSAKKLYTKMFENQMLSENFSGSWSKDKSKFMKQMSLNSQIGLDFEEYVDDSDYSDEENY